MVPAALLRVEGELPFVDFGHGTSLKVVFVDLDAGIWIVRTRFAPGTTIRRHQHTGAVFAFTLEGTWKYLEYPEVNEAGSFLYEPAGSIHTLHAPADQPSAADVWFVVHGANLEFGPNDEVAAIVDAASILGAYQAICQRDLGIVPPVLGARS